MGNKTEKAKPTNRIGVIVTDLTAEEREAFQVPKGGVLVQDVTKGVAKTAGIQPGDVILRLGNDQINDVATFENSLKNVIAGKSIPVLVQRRGSPAFLALKIDK